MRASRCCCRCRIPFRSVLQSPPTSDQEDPDASVLLSRTQRLATVGRALDLRIQLASFRIFTCGLLVTCAVELVFEWHTGLAPITCSSCEVSSQYSRSVRFILCE
ncbi:hypothetical protein RR48_03352 [Papilio machaon]|uniref:Uncharacterized protein n=1 Tax=Papilio machaon TaxID=76193 RepID=A0A0N1IQD9_PAPMA|nr:hypothetical protein RR48_03352 [Papilio machaon]